MSEDPGIGQTIAETLREGRRLGAEAERRRIIARLRSAGEDAAADWIEEEEST